ncbi:hypothetical protein [Pelagicoccus mobilis]|uniref:Uncharacterized protein n=1 Tax=Pelagicoccus mobilis TaxID=415221 RepID=A0A934RW89_9BACT|nr:hypothetical protein [Pelagicoccus mobilis]MBK1876630.1 hypothetical protein [Pelagicoccus mobilis]
MNSKSLYTIFISALISWTTNGQDTTATSITQYGITWNFSEEHQVGKFINGDYYVIAPESGIQIQSVSPKPENNKNGSMLNPQVGGTQGYDNSILNYDTNDTLNFPTVVLAGNSLVSTVSLTDSDQKNGYYYPTWNSDRISKSQAALKTAAVLTILAEAPPKDSFRPPLVGKNKKIYRFSDIGMSILPKLPSPLITGDKIEYLSRGLERPWLTHLSGWTCRRMHPIENMKNYHEYVGMFLSEASSLALTDKATDDFLIRYIQMGIDMYHTSTEGYGDSSFFKWPVIFTGLLLNDESMQNVFIEDRNKTPGRTEKLFYFWKDKKSTIESKIVPPGQTYSGETVFFRKQIGNSEYEHLHPSEWHLADNGGGGKSERYRHCCDSHPHIGMILCAQILNKTELWNDDAAIAYADRWMNEKPEEFLPLIEEADYSITPSSGNTGSNFISDMWLLYRHTEPPENPSNLETVN